MFSGDIYSTLLQKKRYRTICDSLRQRAQNDPRLLYSYANIPEFTLIWLLSDERFVRNYLVKKLRKKEYSMYPAKAATALIADKQRVLYHREWPDRIVHTVLTEILTEYWEDIFPDCLYSYRKGRDVWQAINTVTTYISRHSSHPLYILKRDVKSYGDSIAHDAVMSRIDEYLPDGDPFILSLIRQCIHYEYIDSDGNVCKKTVGLPTGMPLNCVLENLYLLPLDYALHSMNNLVYIRYGDDIFAASSDFSTICHARDLMDDIISREGLRWNTKKSLNCVLQARGDNDTVYHDDFTPIHSFDYLGVCIAYDGAVTIKKDKLKKWRAHFKNALHKALYGARLLSLSDTKRLDYLITAANRFLTEQHGHIPTIIPYLTRVTRDDDVISLDTWIAEAVLAVYYGRFSASNFRKTTYKELRERGLVSLYMIRRKMWMKKRR